MLRSAWIVAVALGLNGVSLQAQEQTERSAERGESHQAAPQKPLSPIRIELVETDEAAKARQRGEWERQQREEKDLIAQQRMAEATVAMNEATQSMKNAAWWSFGAVALGTTLLIWTLMLTRQANAAAQGAVDVTRELGRKELRAYISIEIETRWAKHPVDQEIVWFVIELKIVNRGNTPARVSQIVGGGRFIGRENVEYDPRPDAVQRDIMNPFIPPSETKTPGIKFDLEKKQIEKSIAEKQVCNAYLRVEYTDAFDETQFTEASYRVEIHEIPPGGDAVRIEASATVQTQKKWNDSS